MLTHEQQNHVSLLAIIALLMGLIAAVPHYDHADVSHNVVKHIQGGERPVAADVTVDIGGEGDTAECDHGCHLDHHFTALLAEGPKNLAKLASHLPNTNSRKLILITTRRDLRPPISHIS